MRAMRTVSAMTAMLVVFTATATFAQNSTWTEYVSRQDYFSVSFPGAPTAEAFIYPTEYRITLPARRYFLERDAHSYSATVVDYSDAVEIHQARVESCQEAGGDGDICQDDGPEEMRGAIVHASWNIMNRDGADVSHYAHYNSDRVEGHAIRLTNADGSRTSAIVHMHEDRLYILESTVPRGAPAPGIFQISLRFLDREFNPVRYEWDGIQIYSNGYPPPPRIR